MYNHRIIDLKKVKGDGYRLKRKRITRVIQIIRGFVVRLSQLPISARVEIPAEFDRPYQLLLSPNNATRESLAFGVDGGAELAAGGGGRGDGRVVDLVLFDGGEDGVAKFDLGGNYVFLN